MNEDKPKFYKIRYFEWYIINNFILSSHLFERIVEITDEKTLYFTHVVDEADRYLDADETRSKYHFELFTEITNGIEKSKIPKEIFDEWVRLDHVHDNDNTTILYMSHEQLA